MVTAGASLAAVWLLGGMSIWFARQATWPLRAVDIDLPYVFPASFWACLIAGVALGVITIRLSQRETVVTAAVAGVAFLTAPAFLLGVFPAVSGWDTYIHASSALSLNLGDGIPSNNFYARQYPGPATLLATLATATGTNEIQLAVLLTVLIQMALVFVFMAIARRFLEPRAAAYTALCLMALTPAVITNEHFSQWLIGYLAVWSIALLLFGVLKGDRDHHSHGLIGVNIAALLLVAATIASHPFLPVVGAAFVFAFTAWSWQQRLATGPWVRSFLLTTAVCSVAWMIFVATTYFDNGIRFFQFMLSDAQDVVENWAPLSVGEVLRRSSDAGFTLIMTRWAAYLISGLLALTGLLLRRSRGDSFLLLWVAGVGTLSVAIGFASEAPWIQRVLYLVPPFLVVAAGIALKGWSERLRLHAAPASLFAMLLVTGSVLAGFFLWHPPTMLYSVHPGTNSFLIWPQEQAATAFASRALGPGETVGSDLQTMIVYSFSSPAYPVFQHGFSLGRDLDARIADEPLMFDGDLIVRSARQEMMAFQAQDTPPEFWRQLDQNLAASADRIYDNGFARLYRDRDPDR